MDNFVAVVLAIWAIVAAVRKSNKKKGKAAASRPAAAKAKAAKPAKPVRPAPKAQESAAGDVLAGDPFGQMMMEAIRELKRQDEEAPEVPSAPEVLETLGEGESLRKPREERPLGAARPAAYTGLSPRVHTETEHAPAPQPDGMPGLRLTFEADEMVKGVIYGEILNRRLLRRFS